MTISGSSAITAYAISVDVDTAPTCSGDANNDAIGIVFGYVDDNNYYRVVWNDFDSNYTSSSEYRDFSIIKVENGVDNVLATKNQLEIYNTTGTEFNLKVEVDEDGISAYIDDKLIITAANEQPAMKTFGLWTDDNDSGVAYDNVKVETINKTIIEETNDLNLDDIISHQINDADIIDLENGIANNLDIDINDVIDLVDSDKELLIRGDLEDSVDLDVNQWSKGGTQEVDGSNYTVYTGTGVNSTIKLLIEDDIDVNPDI